MYNLQMSWPLSSMACEKEFDFISQMRLFEKDSFFMQSDSFKDCF